MAHAEAEFSLSRIAKNGFSRRQNYIAGRVPDHLWKSPPMPEELAHVWMWFCELSASRTIGMSGANPISWLEMQAYFNLTNECPTRFELNAIRLIDISALSDKKE